MIKKLVTKLAALSISWLFIVASASSSVMCHGLVYQPKVPASLRRSK